MLKESDEQRLETPRMKLLRYLLGITKLHRERNRSVRERLGVQNIVLETQQCQLKWLQHLHRTDVSTISKRKHWSISQRQKKHGDARIKDGRIKFTLRVKEQALHQLFRVHDDDDDDDDEVFVKKYVVLSFQTSVRSKCYSISKFSTRSSGDVLLFIARNFWRSGDRAS